MILKVCRNFLTRLRGNAFLSQETKIILCDELVCPSRFSKGGADFAGLREVEVTARQRKCKLQALIRAVATRAVAKHENASPVCIADF
jgi:hypothetical protein